MIDLRYSKNIAPSIEYSSRKPNFIFPVSNTLAALQTPALAKNLLVCQYRKLPQLEGIHGKFPTRAKSFPPHTHKTSFNNEISCGFLFIFGFHTPASRNLITAKLFHFSSLQTKFCGTSFKYAQIRQRRVKLLLKFSYFDDGCGVEERTKGLIEKWEK